MSLTNPNTPVSQQDLQDFYHKILPYLGRIVTSKAGFTPIGTIISVMGVTAPANYLACDGTVHYITDYEDLANYFEEQFGSKNVFGGDGIDTFAVPDLRGEFLRGTGTNSHASQGSGANVGVHQDGTEIPLLSITEEGSSRYIGGQFTNYTLYDDNIFNYGYDSIGEPVSSNTWAKSDGNNTTTYRGRATTRPTNTSVLYCIATKNFLDTALDYSTDEKVVGTWIDGKPIYQKTIQSTLPNCVTLGTLVKTYVDMGVEVEKYISVTGFIDVSGAETVNKTSMPINVSNTTSFTLIRGVPNDGATNYKNKIEIGNATKVWNGATVYITVQYTKTTD